MNICDMCIKEKLVFQRTPLTQYKNVNYCVLEQNVKGLTGKYRILTEFENEDYNFYCIFIKRKYDNIFKK